MGHYRRGDPETGCGLLILLTALVVAIAFVYFGAELLR